jgi:hypothetical protein
MNNIKNFLMLGIFSLAPILLHGDTARSAYVRSSEGEYYIQIESEQTLAEVEEEIKSRFNSGENEHLFLEIALNSPPLASNSFSYKYVPGDARNYYAVLTPQEFGDIRYIVTFLGSRPSALSLGWNKRDLEVAGDRIKHIHPLNWLLNVFRNEELKVAFGKIKGSGVVQAKVWSTFIEGIKESLSAESRVNNMKQEYIEHFSKELELNSATITALIRSGNWDGLFEKLMAIPRKGDYEKFGD